MVIELFSTSKVADLQGRLALFIKDAISINQYVIRLDVPMGHSFAV